MIKIAFICTGNTCRSPMAEAILKQILHDREMNQVQVCSAGLFPNIGEPMNEHAKKALKAIHVKQTYHKARFCDRAFMKRFDLIFTMTNKHKQDIEPFCKKVVTLDAYANVGEVMDPYGQNESVYLQTAQQLKRAAQVIADRIQNNTWQRIL